jgi:hypothetical protein
VLILLPVLNKRLKEYIISSMNETVRKPFSMHKNDVIFRLLSNDEKCISQLNYRFQIYSFPNRRHRKFSELSKCFLALFVDSVFIFLTGNDYDSLISDISLVRFLLLCFRLYFIEEGSK